MKKSFLILLCCLPLLFTSCKTLQNYTIPQTRSIENKLPALVIDIDTFSVRRNLKIQTQIVWQQNFETINSDLNGILVNDFNNNICEKLVQKIGTITCKLTKAEISTTSAGNRVSDLYLLQMSNMYNYPLAGRESTIELCVDLKNINNKLIKSYTISGSANIKNGLSSGYNAKNIDRVVISNALIYALENLKDSIQTDYLFLNKSLYASLSKNQLVSLEKAKKRLGFVRDSIQKDVAVKESIRIQQALSLYNQGSAKLNSKDFTGAIEDFTKSIQLNATYANSYNNRGIAYLDLGKYKDAIKDFDQCLNIDPNSELAKNNKQIATKKQSEKTLAIIGTVALAVAAVAVTVDAVNKSAEEASNSNNTSFSDSQTTNSNSINSAPSKHKCGYCNGSGECPHCNLLGQSNVCMKGSFGGKPCSDVSCLQRNHRCKQCGGTHKCPKCNGK